MALLHTHEIRLRPGVVVDDGQDLTTFPALTQRGAAAVLADLWADLKDGHDGRLDYAYWYFQYNRRTPYEVGSAVPDTLRARLIELREALSRDPRVASLAEED
jgi:hypothetical protein